MEKMAVLRSVCRSAVASLRSSRSAVATGGGSFLLRRHPGAARSFYRASAAAPPSRLGADCRSALAMGLGSRRYFSDDIEHMPEIKDPQILNAFKDLMANNWDELPDDVLYDVRKALSKSSEDEAGKEILANILRAAEAVEEFSGILVSMKMELDDSVGLSGEDVKPLPDELSKALQTVFERYTAYLNAFGPEEGYLRKKVETELGTKMIHLKMRCGRLASDWGKVTVLGTSGLSGSYIEQRA
ncbi:succinate dehydrogenase subunit 5, mitochondrial-like [Punica granatum]|uniref:Succinate dehydrogenase subunit 5, mitochondrial-like n=1 Tax=Punica granatum TaxID=22663 RepID=A0A6P8EJW0_PUNGR|nr:succinate dehydrogenase subunit 5, mitochondrial-like [Punica granatum]